MRFDPTSPLDPTNQALFQFWSLQPTLERLVAGQSEARSTSLAFALYQRPDAWLLRTPLPGVSASALTLEVDGNALTLAGTWPEEALDSVESRHVERPRGSFRRTLRLPFELDPERVRARLQNGVLEVELPRAQTTAVRIQVRSGDSRN